MDCKEINFKNEKEEIEYNKYLKLKGKYLYNQVYKVLLGKSSQIEYKDFSSLIRYDKNLRDFLYKYLATFEEYIRVIIFENLIYSGDDNITHNNYNKIIFQKDNSKFDMNLYNHFNLELGPTIEILLKYELINEEQKNNFYQIRQLRNFVMHFNMLILGKIFNYEEALDNKTKIQNQIKILKKCLPLEYQKGFKVDLNNLIINENIKEFKIIIED